MASFSLAEIFQFLSVNQSSGSLRVSDGENTRTLKFQAGVLTPVGEAQSYVPRLGDFLMKRGLITQEQLEAALATQKERGAGRLGELLVEAGVVTDQQILGAVREKLEEEIYDLFLWKNAFFEFDRDGAGEDDDAGDPGPGGTNGRAEPVFQFNTSALLMEAVRRADEWGPISQNVPTLRYIFVPATSETLALESPECPLKLERVSPHLGADSSVREVIEAVGASKFDVCKTLDLLRRESQITPLPTESVGLAFDDALRNGQFAAAARQLEYVLDLGADARGQRDRMLKAFLGDRGVSQATSAVRLTGRAESLDRPAFIQALLLRRLTGTIRVHDLESERCINLAPDGLVLESRGARETPKLGRVLLAAGHITQRQLDTALAVQRGDPRRVGEILIDQGHTTAEAVTEAVLTKVVHELYDLFLWRNAFFEFTAGGEPLPMGERPVRLDLELGHVHKDLVERVTRAGEVLAKIASSQAVFCLTERAEQPGAPGRGRRAGSLSGDVVELQLLALINSRRNVHDLLRLANGTSSEVCESLAALLNQGKIRPLTLEEIRAAARETLKRGQMEACLKLCRFGRELDPADAELNQIVSEAAARRSDAGEAGHEYRLEGDLESFSLAELVQSLYLNKHSGTLKVKDDRREKIIYFDQGSISLLTRGASDVGRIGDILVDMGKVTELEIESALEAGEGSGKRLGELLVEEGLVTDADVQEAVETKVRDEIFDVFLWKRAGFEFLKNYFPDEFTDPEAKVTRLTLDTTRTLMEAINRMERWEHLLAELAGLPAIYRPIDGAELDQLSRRARQLLPRTDGRHTVEEIVEDTPIGRFMALETLYELKSAGAIQPLDLDELNDAAEAAFEERDFERCVKFYEFALQLDGDNAGMRAYLEQVRGNVAGLESGRVRMKPFDLVKLFRLIVAGEHTGTLTASDAESTRRVYLGRDEIVVAGEGPRTTPGLLELMQQAGTISAKQLERATAFAERTGRELEDVLVAQGACTTGDFADARKRRVWNAVEDLFTWKEASLEFDRDFFPPELAAPGDPSAPQPEELETSVGRFLTELTERREQWDRFRTVVGSDRLIYMVAERDAVTAPLLRRHKENPLLARIDGRTPVLRLVEESELTDFDAWQALHDLVAGAVIRPLTAAEAAANADAAWVFKDLPSCEAFYRHAMEQDRANPEYQEKLSMVLKGRETSMRRRLSAAFTADRDVASLLETVRRDGRWGTLEVNVDDRIRVWHLQTDALYMVSRGGVRGRRFGERLVEWGCARQAQIDKALKSQERQPRRLGEILVLAGVLAETARDHLLKEKIFEDFHEVLGWENARVRFSEGDPPAELTDPNAKVTVLSGATGDVIDAALARESVWRQIHEAVPSEQSIFARRDRQAGGDRGDDRNPVLPHVDGRRSVAEICRAAGTSRYEALSAFMKLVRNNVISPLEARECRALAEEAYINDDLPTALALYRYAVELAPDDEKLQRRLERVEAAMERRGS